MNLNRRKLLTVAGASAAAAFFGSGRAFATIEEVNAAIAEYAGGAEPTEGGALTLSTPEIAENGNSVPVSVTVDSPMTEDSYVESVMIMAEDNPNPEVVTFRFTPMSGEANASTRMRLARTQNVVAVAKLNTGEVFKASSNIKVTIGGCGG